MGNTLRHTDEVANYTGSLIASGGAVLAPFTDGASAIALPAGFALGSVGSVLAGIPGRALQGYAQAGYQGAGRKAGPKVAELGITSTLKKFGTFGEALLTGKDVLSTARGVYSPERLDPRNTFERCDGTTLAGK